MTTREEIAKGIEEAFTAFSKAISGIGDEDYNTAPAGKWSPARHLDHLLRSTSPVYQAIALPSFMLRMLFGKPNRTPRTYDQLVARYKEKLAAGGKASGRFIPAAKGLPLREVQLAAFMHLEKKLKRRVEQLSEKKLDNCLLPHPLLGKLTLREMLFFTIYHTIHHRQLLPGS